MKNKSLPNLSASEQALMDQLWRLGTATLLDLLEGVNADRSEPITRNTLQTQLSRLEAKGWVTRDDSGRAHRYTAAVVETSGRKRVLAELKRRFFGGSSLALVRCLVEGGEMNEGEISELRKLIKDKTGKTKDNS